MNILESILKKIILMFVVSFLTVFTGTMLTSSFANLEDANENYNLVQGIKDHTCGADGGFRLAHVNSESVLGESRITEIDFFSVFFKIGEGVVGKGSAKFNIENETSPVKNEIKCLDGNPEDGQILLVKINNSSSTSYEVMVNGTSLGTVTPDDSEIPYKMANNTKYFIVTGSDACKSQGAFRLVNLNFKNDVDIVKSEIDIFSTFFNITSGNLTGNGTFAGNFENPKEDIPIEFEVASTIICNNLDPQPDEKFNFTLNSIGQEKFQLDLHLQPIR